MVKIVDERDNCRHFPTIYFYFYVYKFLIPFFIVFYQFKRLNYVQYAISNVIRMLFCSQVIVLSYFLLPITILGRDTINILYNKGSWKTMYTCASFYSNGLLLL